ncbi:MAG TPA: hypothetical protein VES01_05120 [Dermatophilaceae bacterium]|nr:hypothetical protein [Dermatophilaceae bacterium]
MLSTLVQDRKLNPEAEVVEGLVRDAVVCSGGNPSSSDATLLAIRKGLGVAKKELSTESEGMSTKDVKRRVQEASTEVARAPRPTCGRSTETAEQAHYRQLEHDLNLATEPHKPTRTLEARDRSGRWTR